MSETSEPTSDSPTMEMDLTNSFSNNKIDIGNNKRVFCDTRKDLFNNEDGSFSIKCNDCDFVNKVKNFVEFQNGQSKIKTLKCKKCNKQSVVKIYVDTTQKLLDNKFVTEVSYKIFSCANTVCKSIFRNCHSCNKQLIVKAIPQAIFLASETIVCNCKKVNTVYLHSDELNLRNSNKPGDKSRNVSMTSLSTSVPKKQCIQADPTSGVGASTSAFFTSNKFELLHNKENEALDTRSHSIASSNSAQSRSQSRKRTLADSGDIKAPKAKRQAARKKSPPSTRTKDTTTIKSGYVPPILINDSRYKFSNANDSKKIISDKLISDLSRILATHKARISRNEKSKNIIISVTDLDKRRFCIEEIKKLKPDLAFIAPKPRAEQIRTTKVIIRNMTHDHTQDEQLEEMERCIGIRPLSMKRITSDVQLCIFDGSFSYVELAEKMKKATESFFCAHKIKPERYTTKSDRILQCKNCLRFNHATSACHAQKRNPTTDIMNSHGEIITVCSNCRDVKPEQHTATQSKCPHFQREIKKQKTKREEALLREEEKHHNKQQQQQAPKQETPREHQSRPRERKMRDERKYASVTANNEQQEQSRQQNHGSSRKLSKQEFLEIFERCFMELRNAFLDCDWN